MNPPSEPNAAQPNWFKMGDSVGLSWIESTEKGGLLRFSLTSGSQWSDSRTVVHHERMLVNWADVPKLEASGDFMVAVWPCRMKASAHGYGLRYQVSADAGRSWSRDRWLHRGRTPTEYGFVSLVARQPKTVSAIWLDGSDLSPADGHDHDSDGSMQLRFAEIGIDGVTTERILDRATCECCQTDMALGPQGLVAAFRDRAKNQIRDIGFVFEHEGEWTPSRILFPDGWQIHGCPVNGPAIDIQGPTLAWVWFTGKGTPRVQVGFWNLSEQKPVAHLVLPGTPLGRVDTDWIDTNRLAVTWLEARDQASLVMLAVLVLDGKTIQTQFTTQLGEAAPGRAGGFPRLIHQDHRLLVAFPSQKGLAVKRVTLKKKTEQNQSSARQKR